MTASSARACRQGSGAIGSTTINLAATYKASLAVNHVEASVLLAFHKETVGREFILRICTPFSVEGFSTEHRARFISKPQLVDDAAGEWRYSFELWLLESSFGSLSDLWAYALFGDRATEFFNLVEQIANVELPTHWGAS